MKLFKHWQVFDNLPPGWVIDKTAGSPLHGHKFCHNGKSVLNGGKRALVRVRQPQQKLCLDAPSAISKMETTSNETPAQKIEQPYPSRTVNELARERFKLRLLNDIRCDLMICEIEGWSKTEYIDEIRKLINGIGKQALIDA